MSATTAGIPPVALPYDTADAAANDEARRQAINEGTKVLDKVNDAAPLEEAAKDGPAARGKKERRSGKRIVVCVLLLALLVVGGFFALWTAFGSSGEQKQPTHRVTTDPNRKNESFSNDEEKYAAAISALATSKESSSGGLDPAERNPRDGGPAEEIVREGSGLGDESGQVTESGTRARPAVGGGTEDESVEERGRAPEPQGEQSKAAGNLIARIAGPEVSTSARSMPFSARSRLEQAQGSSPGTPVLPNTGTAGSGRASHDGTGVALPPFGAMLPVRSLGMIYTLRSSGGLVRFELTREVSGRGWLLKKGTVVIGALRGSDIDRAFISVVGFIDQDSGGFVKITGDVLGGDGASGVRGRKRKVSSGFSQVFKKLGDAGLSALGALAGGLGRGTVIITDAYSRGASPLTSELNGILGAKRNEFIEVKAATSAYVMITQLPGEVHGVDALSNLSSESLNSLSDSSQVRQATGLSESKMAELISTGDVGEIRAALPSMTPEMRRIAEAVLAQAEGK